MPNPKLPDEITELVEKKWRELRDDQGEVPVAKQVMRAVEAELKIHGKERQAPKIRKVQDIVKPLRKNDDDFYRDYPHEQELNRAWSIVTLAKHPLPPDTLPKVMRVWRLKTAIGYHLSIRRARWVAYLSRFPLSLSELISMSSMYANHELRCKQKDKPLDSSDIDIVFWMGEWEKKTVFQTTEEYTERLEIGFESTVMMFEGTDRLPDFLDSRKGKDDESKDGFLVAQMAEFELIFKELSLWHDTSQWHRDYDKKLPRLNHPDNPIPNDGSPIKNNKSTMIGIFLKHPSGYFEFTNEESWWVYARWLTYIRKSHAIRNLSLEQIFDLVTEIRNWVKNQETIEPNDRLALGFVPDKILKKFNIEKGEKK